MALENLIGQYFLNPPGLLSLLGLIPLLAFYFFRPEPEEKIMPSMRFFQEDQKSGVVSQAFDRILRNLLLLLHILVIIGLASAIGQMQLDIDTSPDKAVIILDRSASMQNDYPEAKSFAREKLGSDNTLIVAGETARPLLEEASRSRTLRALEGIETADVRTDVASAISMAENYEGKIYVASDLDQSINSRNAGEQVSRLKQNGRKVEIMDSSPANSHGIIEVNPGEENSSVEIKNFQRKSKTLEVNVNGREKTLEVPGGGVEKFEFSSSRLNRVELEEDELAADNTAYISVPEREAEKVVYIADSSNPYLEKAVELMDVADIEYVNPPVDQLPGADIYIIGETERLLKSTVDSIEKNTEKGDAMIVFGQNRMQKLGIENISTGSSLENVSVEIEEPSRINVGQTEVYDIEGFKGESLSSPPEAVIKKDKGKGNMLIYNIRNDDFRHDFLYPVFWKKIFMDLTEQPEIKELNRDTGETLNTTGIKTPGGESKEGLVELDENGFYNATDRIYAANLASEDESFTESTSIEQTQEEKGGNPRNMDTLLAVLLSLLVFGDLAYLSRMGDI